MDANISEPSLSNRQKGKRPARHISNEHLFPHFPVATRRFSPPDFDTKMSEVAGPSNSHIPIENARKTRTKRAPPKRLPVKIPKRDVWNTLLSTDAGLTVADWLAMNKSAAKDIKDGLRYLHGRKKIPIPPINMVINQEDTDTTLETDTETDNDTDDDIDTDMNTDIATNKTNNETDSLNDDIDSENGINDSDEYDSAQEDSDDTTYTYKYNFNNFSVSQPLKAPIMINNHIIPAIFDSGASVSVIGQNLAVKLGLKPTGDKLTLSSLDGESKEPCHIVKNVPVRVAGKLRPDTMCVKSGPSSKDLCLLGMTWFRTYGIQLRPRDSTIIIPTKHESGYVELKGETRRIQQQSAQVYSINIRLQKSPEPHETYCPDGPRTPEQDYDEYLRESQLEVSQNQFVTPPLWENNGTQNANIFQQEEHISTGNQLLGYVDEALSETSNEETEIPNLINDLLNKNQHAFAENNGLGLVNLLEHHIPTTTAQPIRSRPYRLTWEEDKALKMEINHLLELGLIRPSQGLWTSPVFFVKKRDGGLRLVVDYRKLNQLTIKDAFPLPHIDDLLDSLGGATWFSTLDAASGFWQIPVAQDSIEKTGFVTRHGTYEFTVMPFGLTSAPSTFQRTMSIILQQYIGTFVYVFIDDIIIFSKSLSEHAKHLELVFQACHTANLRLKKSKCLFARRSVEYLGHVVSDKGLLPCARNVDKVITLPQPQSTNDIHTFLGMTGYYRCFIPDYAKIAQPLTKLLQKNNRFIWTRRERKAFDTLKKALVNPPILAYPDKEMIQILTTDASTKGLGAILSQAPPDDPENETVIAYGSRGLRGPERNYAATHLEALALVWGTSRFRHYLSGRRFILRTDHAALVYIIKNPNPSAKLSRWSAALMEYDFIIEHKPGKSNPADALSRLLLQ
ncbi:hypothetical protein INT47_009222 [Mucor saturninus]|uniref:RNA-directed DNA polymerase n=1 Tax=Mucor saturninus TaxID=64648 RepID=A0A8H7QFS0_9FUNG|nr:hypothetical protein INT47_009222 [Mucor saturninus]